MLEARFMLPEGPLPLEKEALIEGPPSQYSSPSKPSPLPWRRGRWKEGEEDKIAFDFRKLKLQVTSATRTVIT